MEEPSMYMPACYLISMPNSNENFIIALQCMTCGDLGKEGLSLLDPEYASLLNDAIIIHFEHEDAGNSSNFICHDCAVEIKNWRKCVDGFQTSEIERVLVVMEPEECDSPQQTVDAPVKSKLPKPQIPTSKFLQCGQCCFLTNLETELKTHVMTEHTPGALQAQFTYDLICDQCDAKTNHPEIFAWHNENCHGTNPIVTIVKIGNTQHYQCIFCDIVENRLSNMMRHLYNRHEISNLPFRCDVCEKQFAGSGECQRHQAMCINVNKTDYIMVSYDYKCEQCNGKFNSSEIFEWHTKFCHGPEAIAKIVGCSKSRLHYQCSFCNNIFTGLQSLLFHLRREHNFRKLPFKCHFCDSHFVHRPELKKHQNIVHPQCQC